MTMTMLLKHQERDEVVCVLEVEEKLRADLTLFDADELRALLDSVCEALGRLH